MCQRRIEVAEAVLDDLLHRLKKQLGPGSFGTTRWSSHGYAAVFCRPPKTLSLWRLQRSHPDFEFKILLRSPVFVCFRTRGSTGWHGDGS